MSDQHLPGLPMLDALRPLSGWRTELAVLSTYSLDLTVGVACLLSLAGLDDDRGSGSKVDLANAVEQLRERVRFIVQSGRIAVPGKTHAILALLDNFVQEKQLDEKISSWHAKAALCRYVEENGGDGVVWRFWISSRNLTRDISWDLGLLLSGSPGDRESNISGIYEAGAFLIDNSEIKRKDMAKLKGELLQVRWKMPEGIDIQEVSISSSEKPFGLPQEPDRVHELVVISPFLDGSFLRNVGQWGDKGTQRYILSTLPELRKMAGLKSSPLDPFGENVLALAESLDEGDFLNNSVPGLPNPEENKNEDYEEDHRGLHAKIILARHHGGRSIWFGSANATERAWAGGNVEIIVQASCTKTIQEQIDILLKGVAWKVCPEEIANSPEEDLTAKALEKAQKEVSFAWECKQRITSSGQLTIQARADAKHWPTDPQITLEIASLGGSFVQWPSGQQKLPLGSITQGEESELLKLRLALDDHSIEWLQHTPYDPQLPEYRDEAAMARYLDPKTFFAWIRAILNGHLVSDGGGEWNEPPTKKTNRGKNNVIHYSIWMPTLEETLKAWSRNPDNVIAADKKISFYMKRIAEQASEVWEEEDKIALQEFKDSWAVIRQELIPEARRHD